MEQVEEGHWKRADVYEMHSLGPLSKFFQETKKWLGLKCRCLIEKHVDDWFIGRLENGLPASLPYDAHYSIGDSVEGSIIDFHLPAQQFVLTLDLKKPIRFTFDPSSTSITQCTILCQLPAYALAIHPATHHLIHLPTFSDLNSFYSNFSSSGTYQRQQEVELTAATPFVSEQNRYIIVVPSGKKQSSVRVYQTNDSVSVTIVDVLPKQLNVKLNDGSRGRIHITEVSDTPVPENFSSLNEQYQPDQTLNARVIGTRIIEQSSKHHRPVYELSLRQTTSTSFDIGQRVVGFVEKMDEKTKGYWFHLSVHIRGYLPPEFASKPLTSGQCYHVTIMNKTVNEKGDYYTLSTFDSSSSDSNVVYARFKEIKSANEFHFQVRKGEEEYEGILISPDVADVYEDFVFWNLLMNVKAPLLLNGQVNLKKELWKFRNKTVRAFVKEENAETKQMILSTRKSRSVVRWSRIQPFIAVHFSDWRKIIWMWSMMRSNRSNRSPSVTFFTVTSIN